MSTKCRDRVAAAFLAAKRILRSMDGACLEASVFMHRQLKAEGFAVKLRRYETKEFGGHWTISTPCGEFDPTIGFWSIAKSRWGLPARLIEVSHQTPHHTWKRTSVDEALAYEVASNLV